MSTAFTDTERAILRIVQFQLPDTLTPYADIAREVGTDEETVLNLLRRMKEDGSIRRFGASIKHQKTGWTHNAMVAWIVDEADSDAIIVKGLISLLVRTLSGHTPQEIIDADLYFINEIKLNEHLSPTRSNGLRAMVKQMRLYAIAFDAQSKKD